MTEDIPILLPVRVSPLVNVKIFSLLLNVVQSVRERKPLLVRDACQIPNNHVRLL